MYTFVTLLTGVDGHIYARDDVGRLLKEALTRLEKRLRKEHSRRSSRGLSGVDSDGQPLTQEGLMLQVRKCRR